MPKLLIIGGGLAAVALVGRLNAANIPVTIAEQAQDLSAGGYVIGLYKNGFDMAAQLGLAERAKTLGWLPDFQLLTDERGRQLRYTDLSFLHEKHGAALRFYSRSALHKMLCELLTADNDIRLGTTVTALSEHAAGVEVVFSDGSRQTFDAVVGADGIASKTRRLLFGDVGQVIHNGTFHYAMADTSALDENMRRDISSGDIEMLGRRGYFGIYPVSPTQCGIYAARYGAMHQADATKEEVLRFFSAYTPYARVLAQCIGGEVFTDALREVDFAGWGTARCFLIGDAAHALLPTSGQGASLAMEDGVLLADILQLPPREWQSAFARFEAARQARIAPIRRNSRIRNVAVAHVPPALCGIRNLAIKMLLGRGKGRQLDSFFQHTVASGKPEATRRHAN